MTHESERRMSDTAHAAAERAGEYAQASVSQLRDRARAMARDVERLTGHSLDDWLGKLRAAVRDHPLPALALTIGLGYVLGKSMRRG
jgi:hypothetical protein